MIISITDRQIAAVNQTLATAKFAADKAVEIAVSEKAIHFYKSVVIAVVLLVAVVIIGLGKAAKYYWAEFVRPGAIVAVAYAGDKIRGYNIGVKLQSLLSHARQYFDSELRPVDRGIGLQKCADLDARRG